MKSIRIFLLFMLAVGIFTACEDELDPIVPDDAVAPQLISPAQGGTYVLEKVNETDTFATFEWSEADFKLDVVTNYAIEVDDVDGDWSKRKTVMNNVSSPAAITVSDFNKGLLAAGYEEGTAHEIKVRVVANNALATEPIDMVVTPYFDVDAWTVIGSAVGGWDAANDQYMEYDKENGIYSITLDLSPGEFKFRAPNKNPDDAWAHNLGLDGDARSIEEGEDIELSGNGANIGTPGGNYTIHLNVAAETFTIIQNEASEITDWTGVVLDAVGEGISADNPNASADESSWAWGNVLVADNEGVPQAESGFYTWTWEGVVLEADLGFKIRTLNGEAAPQNGISFDLGYAALDAENSSDKVVDSDGNFTVSEKGEYDITVTIDAINGDVKTVTINEAGGDAIYMIGAATGGWDTALAVKLPATETSGVYSTVAYFDAESDGNFRFFDDPDWGASMGGYDIFTDYPTEYLGEMAGDSDPNFEFVGTTGWFEITADVSAGTITMTPVDAPEIYLVGDATQGWNFDDPVATVTGTQNYIFEGTVTFTQGGFFRMFEQKDWGPVGYGHDLITTFDSEVIVVAEGHDDPNWEFVGATGDYNVTVNKKAGSVEITPVQ